MRGMPETMKSQIIVNQPEPIQKPKIEPGMIEIEQLDFKYGGHQVLHDGWRLAWGRRVDSVYLTEDKGLVGKLGQRIFIVPS